MNPTAKWILIVVGILLGICILSSAAVATFSDEPDMQPKINSLQKDNKELSKENEKLYKQLDRLEKVEPVTVTEEVLSETCKQALDSTTQSLIAYTNLVSSLADKLLEWTEDPYGTNFDSVLAEQAVTNANAVSAAAKAKECYPELGS